MSFECDTCDRKFNFKSNYSRHLRMVHNIFLGRNDIQPGDINSFHFKCLEGCNISYKYNRELRKHLKDEHEVEISEKRLEFPNSEEFNKWLQNEEKQHCVQFVHLTATKKRSTGTETFYYECSHTGKSHQVNHTVRKRKPRKLLKLNRGCTSQIIAHKAFDGAYCVTYFQTHYGHEIGLEHIKLSKQDRGTIASKLLLGMPVSSVLNSVKNKNGTDVKRINLIQRKDVLNINNSFKDDVLINLKNFLFECNMDESPILYSNLTGPVFLIIMTKFQSDILQNFGDDVVLLDCLSLKNCCFHLITLFVVNGDRELFPTCCAFVDELCPNTYELFFGKIKETVGEICTKLLVTNCSDFCGDSWQHVMTHTCVIYNPIQLEIEWKLNLNLLNCPPELVQKKRNWLMKNLKMLQQTTDELEFQENHKAFLETLSSDATFTSFFEYFTSKYHDITRWSSLYAPKNLPFKQIRTKFDLLRQYLNEENEKRFDRVFHSLLRFIRDESICAIAKIQDCSIFIQENDSRHQILEEKTFDSVNLAENLFKVIDDSSHFVQKLSEKACCSLICSTCLICVHSFSCTCVDFFVSNSICVHIHHVCMNYFPVNCDEEIIIEVDEGVEDCTDLKNEILLKSTQLCENVEGMTKRENLQVILDTLNQLCDVTNECVVFNVQ